MNGNVIISCAVTGAGDTVGKHPAIPVTPEQIANACIEAADAGAAIAHVHVRDPESGAPSHDRALYREVVERVRAADTDVVLNITAGGGGDWFPGEDDPANAGAGTHLQTPAERHAPVEELRPEICTLDCGSYNFADNVYISTTTWLREQAEMIRASGVKPEIECFELGHIRFARQLVAEGLVENEPLFQLCTGIPWAAEADTETLVAMRNKLPANAHWAAFGVGRMQMPIAAQSVIMGGNVRVGLEDNIYLDKGVFASNGQLVQRAVEIIERLGSRTASPAEARERLGLRTPGATQ